MTFGYRSRRQILLGSFVRWDVFEGVEIAVAPIFQIADGRLQMGNDARRGVCPCSKVAWSCQLIWLLFIVNWRSNMDLHGGLSTGGHPICIIAIRDMIVRGQIISADQRTYRINQRSQFSSDVAYEIIILEFGMSCQQQSVYPMFHGRAQGF